MDDFWSQPVALTYSTALLLVLWPLVASLFVSFVTRAARRFM